MFECTGGEKMDGRQVNNGWTTDGQQKEILRTTDGQGDVQTGQETEDRLNPNDK